MMPVRFSLGRLPLVVAGVALLVSACSADGQPASVEREVEAVAASDATRDDVDCTAEELGADDETDFRVAHYVVRGRLGAVCLGEEDPTLLAAWADLVAITPPDQLADLGVFAGFVHPDADDLPDDAEVTLAFVNTLDDEGSTFQMSVDLNEFDADRNDARLTLAHEFSHVFTTTGSQLDYRDGAADSCTTYRADDGCFFADSLVAEWVRVFWDEGRLTGFDPEAEPSSDGGAKRCAADPSFLGEYAASNPEEDFAETFSAYVFGLEVDAPELQEKLDWMADQPGLVEFRDRAEGAGLVPLDNTFEGCG